MINPISPESLRVGSVYTITDKSTKKVLGNYCVATIVPTKYIIMIKDTDTYEQKTMTYTGLSNYSLVPYYKTNFLNINAVIKGECYRFFRFNSDDEKLTISDIHICVDKVLTPISGSNRFEYTFYNERGETSKYLSPRDIKYVDFFLKKAVCTKPLRDAYDKSEAFKSAQNKAHEDIKNALGTISKQKNHTREVEDIRHEEAARYAANLAKRTNNSLSTFSQFGFPLEGPVFGGGRRQRSKRSKRSKQSKQKQTRRRK